mgnify:CR=1 FL=1|tara:strand:+ start:470 stop:646 length:177 start_codon:yes stop_codon:yes gene_type:complete
MALELKGMDGKWYSHASVDILRKHRGERDQSNVLNELLASIGNELEDINALLKRELRE